MDSASDEQKIRDLIATWLRATAAGDVEQVLQLMAPDVVFLLPGQEPMRGRESFAIASRAAFARIRIQASSDIQEIRISGNYAYCWNRLSITVSSLMGGPAKRREGHTLSVLRKESDGRWLLFRDANLLSDVAG